MNPVAAIATVLAIVLGGWGGYSAMAAIAPDQPAEGVEPGVSAATDPEIVEPGDPGSLLRAGPLSDALGELDSQLIAGRQIERLTLTPGEVRIESAYRDGLFDPDDVDPAAPQRIIAAIEAQRPEVSIASIDLMKLIATAEGQRWYVQLVSTDPKVNPPWSYTARGDGRKVEAGGAEPVPIP